MSKTKRNTLRRSQLISPFGVGSLLTQEDGISVVICGLDFWLPIEQTDRASLEIQDDRLKERLKVAMLYKPASLPERVESSEFRSAAKPGYSIPVLRFPTFYSCKSCNKLSHRSQNYRGKVECAHTSSSGKSFNQEMFQVPYVIMCEDGHLDDFPWRQWVHRTLEPTCNGELFLKAATTGNLQNSIVVCSCNKKRSVANAMSKTASRSNLTLQLDDDSREFVCSGSRPWLGESSTEGVKCGKEVWAAFRGAGNVYFPNVESSILIPDTNKKIDDLCQQLIQLIYIHPRSKFETDPSEAIQSVRHITSTVCAEAGQVDWLKNEYSDDEIFKALSKVTDSKKKVRKAIEDDEQDASHTRTQFLYKEFEKLQMPSQDDRLAVQVDERPYGIEVSRLVKKVHLVTSLTETRAFWGFSRVEPKKDSSYFAARTLLRRYKTSPKAPNDWLPAIQVKGEGIFFTFDDELLEKWSNKDSVKLRFNAIQKRQNNFFASPSIESPKYILLHTLAHLLIKELTFFCGYGQASLQERLYISNAPDSKMSGILIYTASGDSEGTLGGLVRMGKPGYLEEIFTSAIEKATWCSNDPVCSESSLTGFGDEISPASCFACTLLPETSCEGFNKNLDRGFLVGLPYDTSIAFLGQD